MAKILIPMPMGEVPHAHDPCPAVCSSLLHGGISWGDDEEGVSLYLRANGVSSDDIAKEGVAQSKESTRFRSFGDVKPGVPLLHMPGKYYG
jgi:hypothetical protein